jgi:5-methyltetrahydrofolate--homocysteine methyltransferase
MTRTILDLVKERVVLLDGGMGTELIKQGFPQGECPERSKKIIQSAPICNHDLQS